MNSFAPASGDDVVASPISHARFAIAATLITLGVYVLTIAPDLTWANASFDGVELIIASATLGVPHPPGYPTYVVLGKLFSFLPIGSVAFRYNLFSAFATALAAGLLVPSIGALYPRVRPPAVMAAALLFGFAPLVWSQAIVTEIYGLNLLALALFLAVWSRRGPSLWSGFLLGLAVTTHLTSLFFLPALLISSGRRFLWPLLGWTIGLTPLLATPFLAACDSPVIWGQPNDLAGWWWLVSGRLYRANLQPGFDAGHLAALLQAIVLGPALMVSSRGAKAPMMRIDAQANVKRQPMTTWLGLTAILYIAFALFYRTPDAAVLLLPVFLIVAILIAPLLDRLGIAALFLPLALVVLTFNIRDLGGDFTVRQSAESLLDSAPENALLLTPGDRTIFTVLYFQHIEGSRTDLRIVDANLFAFDWYRSRLKTLYPDLFVPERDDLILLKQNNVRERPFCLVSIVSASDQFFMADPLAAELSMITPQLYCRESPE